MIAPIARALSTSRPQDLALDHHSPREAARNERECRVAELQARREELKSAAARTRAHRQDLENAPAPVRLLRRRSIAIATAAEQTTQAELAHVERDLTAANEHAAERGAEKASQTDPCARLVTRGLDRRLVADRQPQRGIGIER